MKRTLHSILFASVAGLVLFGVSRASREVETTSDTIVANPPGFLDVPMSLVPDSMYGTLTLSDHDLPPQLLQALRLDFSRLDEEGKPQEGSLRLVPEVMQRVADSPPSWAFRTGAVQDGRYEVSLVPTGFRTEITLSETRQSIDIVVPRLARTLLEVDAQAPEVLRSLRARLQEGTGLRAAFLHENAEVGGLEVLSVPGSLVLEFGRRDCVVEPRRFEALPGWNVQALALEPVHLLRVALENQQPMPSAWWFDVEVKWWGAEADVALPKGEKVTPASRYALGLREGRAPFLDLGLRRAGRYSLGFPVKEAAGDASPTRRWVDVIVQPDQRNSLTVPIAERALQSLETLKKESK